jgi:hypothetical protein
MTCTCPDRRNGIDCPEHVLNNPMVTKAITATPLFVQIAWELDLNWSTDTVARLFWQHNRYSDWPM